MVTAAHLVEEVIRKKPFLQESLVKGIINYGALAAELLPDIERQLGKPVKHAAVMMALRRLSERLQTSPTAPWHFDEDCSIIARDGLVQVTVEKNASMMARVHALFDKVEKGHADFLTITQGVFEITLITHRKNLAWLRRQLGERIARESTGMSALTLTLPQSFIDAPGFFYIVTRALAWENINLEEIISTPGELTVIVQSTETSRAFSALKRLTRNE